MSIEISETSTDNDLSTILTWLLREEKSKGHSFYCNRDVIRKAHQKGELLVLREGNEAVAFQIGGLLSPGILVVRPDKRGQGYGRVLVQHCIDRAQRSEICFLHIQCTPVMSAPFWQKMGFMLFPLEAPESWGRSYAYPYAYKLLPKHFCLEPGYDEASVVISFFPDGAEHKNGAQPLSEHRPRAAHLADGTIKLESRVIGFHPGHPNDLVIKIAVDGATLCFKRAKYCELLGVQRYSPAFYLDIIVPPSSDFARKQLIAGWVSPLSASMGLS
jgi:GNAT superfamily N-acetyltransferase